MSLSHGEERLRQEAREAQFTGDEIRMKSE
jgi:hypothetical protein